MNKAFSRVISTILFLAMLAGAVACANNEATGPEETTAAEEETERQWIDSLEDTNFNGATFIINALCKDDFDKTKLPDAAAKEVIGAAKLKKLQNVENRFNVTIETPEFEGEVADSVRRFVESDEYAFDYIDGNGLYTAPLAMEGYILDMGKTEEFHELMDLKQPWWWDSYIESLNIGDMYFWLTGYTLTGNTHIMFAIFVNTELSKIIIDDDSTSIYDIVRSGEWTIDKMTELSRKAYMDDGNGEKDDNDRYGFAITGEWIDKLAVCAGADYTKRDEDNIPVGNIETERNININEKLYDLVHDDSFSGNGLREPFAQERVLFYCENLDTAMSYRDLSFDFGIIPMPKYDTAQEEYINTCHYATCVEGLPVNVPEDRYELVYTLVEALAAETYRICRPAELDVALKNKYSRDEETKEMIDLTQDHITTDFLIAYGGTSGYDKLFNEAYQTRDISSLLARKSRALSKVINKYVVKMEESSDS